MCFQISWLFHPHIYLAPLFTQNVIVGAVGKIYKQPKINGHHIELRIELGQEYKCME